MGHRPFTWQFDSRPAGHKAILRSQPVSNQSHRLRHLTAKDSALRVDGMRTRDDLAATTRKPTRSA